MADFEEIRSEGYMYADKTRYVYDLVSEGKYYFLSRPRRFGKSLLLNTLDAFFHGKRNLFKGLAIDELKPEPWESFPVLRLNLSGVSYDNPQALDNYLGNCISKLEIEYGIEKITDSVSDRFYFLIEGISKVKKQKIVILVDEYDAPLTDTVNNQKLQEIYRNRLHSFYTVLKKSEEYIRFCMLTGVTRYGKLSIFSGLNNLNDISFDDAFAGICGITEEELHSFYEEGIKELAVAKQWSVEEAYVKLKKYYDGYHFSESMLDVYNPYSLNYVLYKKSIRNYWCESGNPSILSRLLLKNDLNIDNLEDKKVNISFLSHLSADSVDPIVLLYQTGYLTLKSYDEEEEIYTLGYPNLEVEKGLLSNLLKTYTDQKGKSENVINDLRTALKEGETDKFIKILNSFLTDIPSKLKTRVGRYENYYHTILYCIFKLIGLNTEAEYNTSEGFIDMVIKTNKFIYIIELKTNGTAVEALDQIERKHYAHPFESDSRKLIKMGLEFSKTTHQVKGLTHCEGQI